MKQQRSRSVARVPRASLDEPSRTITVEPLTVPVPIRTPTEPAPPEREPLRERPTSPDEPAVPTP
jgi:hypothetical protein